MQMTSPNLEELSSNFRFRKEKVLKQERVIGAAAGY